MATGAAPSNLASQARRLYTEELVKGLVGLVQAVMDGSRALLDKPSEHAIFQRRRDMVQGLMTGAQSWHKGIVSGLRHALMHGVSASRPHDLPPPGGSVGTLSLVDDDTIELEIVTSRLALAIMDRASWEFADLRSRVAHLEHRAELDPHDMLRAHVLARIVFEAWRASAQTLEAWRELQPVLHEEFALLVEEAYHETNRWLAEHKVLPDVDLRPFIRRSRTHPNAPMGSIWQHSVTPPDPGGYQSPAGYGGGSGGAGYYPSGGGHSGGGLMRGAVGEETRLMTRTAPLARSRDHAEAVLGRLNRLVGRHLPGFASSTRHGAPVSPGLARAIETAQAGIRQRVAPSTIRGDAIVTTPVLLEELHQRKQVLKKAAASPEERATIEIVALLFQSILTEERIPAAVRIWFARLQMPVLRVAVSEPDFFATVDHPARRLIDRMGACVMGFDTAAQGVGGALEKEIKRIVQVVEAYPDTGRRVFQTVLTEFEKFLEHYFKNENEATRKGVSLAQQVEQRETLAIQYTIELRRMLNEVPVQEGVRQFLFHVWADVLATTAVRFGPQGDQTKAMKRAAADLIWSASAKVTREERAEVIRRLPLLLKSLREGMASAGMDTARQDEQIQQLNNSLAAAFTAKAAVIPDDRLRELMERLETLEELLPDADDVQIDESMVLDLSGHQSSELEVVLEGGSMPTPAMLAWARELQVGSWYMLEHHERTDPVQLAWQGLRKQLSLFVTPQGRCVLFQQHRLASFLQAGLLLPAQDEALTVRATRSALAKLDVDASRLLTGS
jgi:5-carboxymethyl-2-hydroxymuconate isomerase